jgi:hypothetical protein
MAGAVAQGLRSLAGHKDSVTALCLRSLTADMSMEQDEEKLCSGSDDGHARLWDLVRAYM